MSVARGKRVFSLLHKGRGARAGPGTSVVTGTSFGAFGGAEDGKVPAPIVVLGFGSRPDFGCRFLITRAQFRGGRGGGRKKMTMRGGITLEEAKAMPLSMNEWDNSDLITVGATGDVRARREILIRHIMSTDNVSHNTASETFDVIASKNREGMWLVSLPYKLGIGIAVTAATVSIPLVFDLETVTWFNEHYVTTDVPEPRDLETPLEYIRAQIQNVGIRPFTDKIMAVRAAKLATAFPQYNATIIKDFSQSVTFYDDKYGIKYDSIMAGK